MKTFNPKCFTRLASVRSIDPQLLTQFLRRFARYLYSHGVALTGGRQDLNYPGIASALMNAKGDMPEELIDALHIINEMSTAQAMDDLVDAIGGRGLDPPGDDSMTPTDVAIWTWLHARDVLERCHAEGQIASVRTFEYFQSLSPRKALPKPSESQLRSLESDLGEWFASKGRGRGACVFVFSRPDGTWFLIRHGDVLKREECLEQDSTTSRCFRPCRYDVVVYHPAAGELCVNARTKREKDLYRSVFGKHLFGDEEHFPGAAKYSLEPLRELGEDSLSCGDAEGIEWIRLTEYTILHPGAQWESVTRKAADVFAMLKAHGREFARTGVLTKAKFKVKFTGQKTPRTVTIRPSNVAQYTRDGDEATIEQWLLARGFVPPDEDPPY